MICKITLKYSRLFNQPIYFIFKCISSYFQEYFGCIRPFLQIKMIIDFRFPDHTAYNK